MDKFVVRRSGPLHGTVRISGAKNAVLPILAACLLTDEPSVLNNVPQVTDVSTMVEILRHLGVEVDVAGPRLTVRPGRYTGSAAPDEWVSKMRASICVLGPLLARRGRAEVSMPGGCVIGARPIDLHLKGLQALGAQVQVEHGKIVVKADRLIGTPIHLAGAFGSSVLGTDNVLMAATLAEGTTVVEHAACEPEVVALAEFLTAMGAELQGMGGPLVRVTGVDRLHGAAYRIIPDRIEAGTFMIATALLGGDVTLEGVRAEHLGALIDKLREAGAEITKRDDALRVRATRRLRAVDVTTLPYPGFPTDLQAPMTALLALAEGVGVITEKIYADRFMHVAELNRMGAQISREGASAIVKGVPRLSGAPVAATDLRAGVALLLAGLAAEGETDLSGTEHIDRGYERLVDKLTGLGCSVRRVAVADAAGDAAAAHSLGA